MKEVTVLNLCSGWGSGKIPRVVDPRLPAAIGRSRRRPLSNFVEIRCREGRNYL